MAADTRVAEAAIAGLLEARRAAWNAGDLDGYRKLLTVDADVVSATGRKSTGRDAVIGSHGTSLRSALPPTFISVAPVQLIPSMTSVSLRVILLPNVKAVEDYSNLLPFLSGRQCPSLPSLSA